MGDMTRGDSALTMLRLAYRLLPVVFLLFLLPENTVHGDIFDPAVPGFIPVSGVALHHSSLYEAAVSPCTESDFASELAAGEGYFFSTYNSGWCRKITAEKVQLVVEAYYQPNTWIEGGTTNLPTTDSSWLARCTDVGVGLTPGALLCSPVTWCMLYNAATPSRKSDLTFQKACPSGCPDGIGAGGVPMYTDHEGWGCIKWGSKNLGTNYQGCGTTKILGHTRTICTKVGVTRVAKTGAGMGVVMMKRMVCENHRCSVFKKGLCLKIPLGESLPPGANAADFFENPDNIRDDDAFYVKGVNSFLNGKFPDEIYEGGSADVDGVVHQVWWYVNGKERERELFGIAATLVLQAFPDGNFPQEYSCTSYVPPFFKAGMEVATMQSVKMAIAGF